MKIKILDIKIKLALSFLILFAIIAIIFLYHKNNISTIITNSWKGNKQERQIIYKQKIDQIFHNHITELESIAKSILSDSIHTQIKNISDINDQFKAFSLLKDAKIKFYQTVDIIDLNGNIYAWSGPSITQKYSPINSNTNIITIIQSGSNLYLTVGIPRGNYAIMVSKPLETNSPIQNNLIEEITITKEISKFINSTVRIVLNEHSITDTSVIKIPIYLNNKQPVAFFIVNDSVNSVISLKSQYYTQVISSCLSISAIILFYILLVIIKTKISRTFYIAYQILSLWAIRYIWFKLDFPAVILNGWLFDSNIYTSSFLWGLGSSLGNVILTAIVITISVQIIFYNSIFHLKNKVVLTNNKFKFAISFIVIYIGSLFLLWLFRGFAESLRSLLFESTINLNNPTQILFNSQNGLIMLCVVLLSYSLISLTIILLLKGYIISKNIVDNKKFDIIILASIILSASTYYIIENSPLVSAIHSLVFLFISFGLVKIIYTHHEKHSKTFSRKIIILIFATSFIVCMPILHQKIQQKDKQDIEQAAIEMLTTADTLFNTLTLKSLIYATDETLKTSNIFNQNIAFNLWIKTALGESGTNSAIIIYDKNGDEVDKFIYGISNAELRTAVNAIYEGEEAIVHSLRKINNKDNLKIYGAWKALVNQQNELLGSIIIVALESHFKDITYKFSQPIQQKQNDIGAFIGREIAINEYRNDTLIYSNGKKLYPEKKLKSHIFAFLNSQSNHLNIIWDDNEINGNSAETIFVKNPTNNKIIAISVEQMDFRWELFAYLKYIIFYIIFIGFLLLISIKPQQLDISSYGFRAKLIIGFTIITLIPLFILSFYNKNLSEEKIKEKIQTQLNNDLLNIQNRIYKYIADYDDFIYGVDDDFCNSITDEYGLDITFYNRTSVMASSRSELYKASLLDTRLNGNVFRDLFLSNKSYSIQYEKFGNIDYVVGYVPLQFSDNIEGVIAIPTLNTVNEFDKELAKRNANVFGIYALVFGAFLIIGIIISMRFAKPLQELNTAAQKVANGNLDVFVKTTLKDEIGILTQSFNQMIETLRINRNEIAKHERENAWKEMAKQVSHEIKNPLTPIKLSMQHLMQVHKDNSPDKNEIIQRVTKTVIEQIDALARIASEFSSFAKMPDSKFERVNINTLLSESTNLFREVKDITFEEKLSQKEILVLADKDQLRRVFINIIRNGIQAIKEKGIISIGSNIKNGKCVITISDNGKGISDKMIDRIFEPNFSTKTEGMGLGLAISQKIINEHGGQILCESKEGIYTTFKIMLPML